MMPQTAHYANILNIQTSKTFFKTGVRYGSVNKT